MDELFESTQPSIARGIIGAITASFLGFCAHFGIAFFTGFSLGVVLLGIGGIAGAATSSMAGRETRRVGLIAATVFFIVGISFQFCSGFVLAEQAIRSIVSSESSMANVIVQGIIGNDEIPRDEATALLNAIQQDALQGYNGPGSIHVRNAEKKAFNMSETDRRSLVAPMIRQNIERLSFWQRHFSDPLAYLWLLFGALAAFRFGAGENSFS